MISKVLKIAKISTNLRTVRGLALDGVAATTEHFEMIRLTKPGSVIDVGANKGQFSLAVRALQPNAELHAFEPLPSAQKKFRRLFKGDERAFLHPVALASENATAELHVATREDSSSLLPIAQAERDAYGVSEIGTITVETRRLESELDLGQLPTPILLKIDVQGGEIAVLKGIKDFTFINFIYVELSFVELYEGQPLFDEVYDFIRERGYRLIGVFNLSTTAAYGPTQVDALFGADHI